MRTAGPHPSNFKAEGWITNRRKQRLYRATFTPPRGTSIAAQLVFHHGLNEHSSRYDHAFERLATQGIQVHTFDAHGHGKSDPSDKTERALVWKFSHLVDDFLQVVEGVVATQRQQQRQQQQQESRSSPSEAPSSPSATPLFIGGHSVGGLVAAHVAASPPSPETRPGGIEYRGVILHSPALDVEWTPILRIQAQVGGLMAALLPKVRAVPAVRPEDMSQDPEVVKDYLQDPLVTKGDVCFRTGNEVLGAFRQIGAKAKGVTIPVYVGHGTQDKCTSLEASRRFVVSVSSPDATLHEFQGGFHELLHGPEWKEATDEIAKWMLDRAKAKGGGTAAVAAPAKAGGPRSRL